MIISTNFDYSDNITLTTFVLLEFRLLIILNNNWNTQLFSTILISLQIF